MRGLTRDTLQAPLSERLSKGLQMRGAEYAHMHAAIRTSRIVRSYSLN